MSQRPPTSKPRGVCMYFRSSRGCRNGDMCKFLHGDGETLTPYDKSKTCKFYAAGFCKHGDKCWFRHVNEAADVTLSGAEETTDIITIQEVGSDDGEVICSICQEKPVTYGLLEDCSHVFCLQCIRGWRDPNGKSQDIVESGNTKRCPYCRTSSKFVTPSSVFYPSGNPMKEATISKYKASMARIPCKYFERSSPGSRYCPFGKDCFYQHKESDGTLFVFDRGADYFMKKARRRHNQATSISFLDMLTNIRIRRETDVLQVLADLEHQGLPYGQEDSQDDDSYDPELSHLLADTMTYFRGVFNTSRASSPSEDEQAEEGQETPSRPSILATPEDSRASSALPLTRAFVDSYMPSEDDVSLTDVHDSENEDELGQNSSSRPSFFRSQFGSYSLPNLAGVWTADLDSRGDHVEDTFRSNRSGHLEGVEQAFAEESRSLTSDDDCDSQLPLDDVRRRLLLCQPESSTENPSAGDGNHNEQRNKSEPRSELAPRRIKSNNGSATCTGRRNGGQTFVTDGRGRVVATDDGAYTDGASLAFWHSPAPVVAPPTDSTNETSAAASVGLGALDDLD